MPNKEYYAKHREEIISKVKKYAEENAERVSYRNYLYRQHHRQKLLERERKRRREHRDEINMRRRISFANNPEKHQMTHRKWYAENRKKQVILLRQRYRNLRKKATDKLGGKCCRCGFTDWRALQIDHVQGNGNKEKQLIGQWKMYKKILELESLEMVKEYQLLCANCNWIKRFENSEVTNRKRDF